MWVGMEISDIGRGCKDAVENFLSPLILSQSQPDRAHAQEDGHWQESHVKSSAKVQAT